MSDSRDPLRGPALDEVESAGAGVGPGSAERVGAGDWSVDDARALYRFSDWGAGFFDVGESGSVVVRPDGEAGREVDLAGVVGGLRERDIQTPVLIRFSDILRTTLGRLREAFRKAIAENEYAGSYTGLYPVKVNQQHHVVDEVRRAGEELGFGLEVGSKPELLAVLALTADTPGQLIVCNGFKDARYIEATTLAAKLGRRIVPVIENMEELRLVVGFAERYGVRPMIGVRVKLSSAGSGRWSESGGSRSKFGLFVSELLDAAELLDEHGMLDCLRLVHCHVGSQVQDIRTIKDTVSELAQVYVRLKEMGATLGYLDVGGGVGVDYTGAQANRNSSMNYTAEEYASDVVYRIGSVCNAAGVEHPTILTECGRAMVAYASVLVVDVLGSTGPKRLEEVGDPKRLVGEGEQVPQPILDLYDAHEAVRPERVSECYHDAMSALEAAMTLFNLGYLSLPMRGLAERLFWSVCTEIAGVCESMEEGEIPEELWDLERVLSDVYFCNFSLFQSLPDSWAIDQLFPIVPIQRLGERPTRRAVLADITCDSDGKVDRFIGDGDESATLEVHALRENEQYMLGFFLVGAYQETLGDLHNLFGDTHVVHLSVDEEGGWVVEEFVPGDTTREVLRYMQYSPERLGARFERDCERAVRSERVTLAEARVLRRFFGSGLSSYTYLDGPDPDAGPTEQGSR